MIKCGEYKIWTDYGYEYDCEYGVDFMCEDCILCGGSMSPVSGKEFRGNRAPYEEALRLRLEKKNSTIVGNFDSFLKMI